MAIRVTSFLKRDHSSNPPSPSPPKMAKMAVMGGDGKFLLNMGGSQEWGGWESFKVSLHSWQRGANQIIL